MNRRFKQILILSLIILFKFPVYAVEKTDLAETRPFLTSLMAVFAESKNLPKVQQEITLYPQRSSLSALSGRNRIVYTVSLQKDVTAPLIFVSPGLGSFSFQGLPQFMAEQAFNAGYSVVTMPSSTHWSFAGAVSSTGRVGYLPQDAKDIYALLVQIKSKLEKSNHLQPRQYALLGYSYGGLEVGFLGAEDLEQKVFNFSFMVAINPPMSRSLAISKIDKYLAAGDKLSEEKRLRLRGYALGKYLDLTDAKNAAPIRTLEDFEKNVKLSENAIAWIIADKFREELNGSVTVSNSVQKTNDTITTSISAYLQDKVYEAVGLKKSIGRQAVEDQSELGYALSQQNSLLINEKRFILFHTANDFLSFPEGQNLLDQLPVEKHILKTGGHLGNVVHPQFQLELKQVLTERRQ
jgi:hypothetical protein